MSISFSTKTSALVDTAIWLSSIFSSPLTAQQVQHSAAEPGQTALSWMGEQLEAEQITKTLNQLLAQDAPEKTALQLERNYTTLFEGIFQHRAVMPYESAWRENFKVPPAAEMDATLRTLNMHISEEVHEPSDHLAIELAALSTALSNEQTSIALDLVKRLQAWVPNFSAALNKKDASGFYAAAGELLLALIYEANKVPQLEQSEGETL